MKRNYFLLFCALTLTCCSCSKNDDSTAQAAVNNNNNNIPVNNLLMSGNWRVGYAYYDGADHTADFNDFRFMFEQSGHTSAANTLLSVDGTWSINPSVTPINVFLDYPDADAPAMFTKISGTYAVAGQSLERIDMRKIVSGTLTTNTLSLQKIQ